MTKRKKKMKLFLNSNQRDYILEILKVSENNAITGNDGELALAFRDLYNKIEPLNVAYINLNRAEAETIVEFCEIVRRSLDNALSFLNKDSNREPEEVADLKDKTEHARNEIEEVLKQLQEKIKNNPVKEELNEF